MPKTNKKDNVAPAVDAVGAAGRKETAAVVSVVGGEGKEAAATVASIYGIESPEGKILAVFATNLSNWGSVEMTTQKVAEEVGYSSIKTNKFADALVALKRAGYVTAAGKGKVKLTEAGVALTGCSAFDEGTAASRFATNQEYHDYKKGLLKMKKADEMFDLLKNGRSKTKWQLAKGLGYTTSESHIPFYALKELKARKLVEKPGARNRKTLWRLVDDCFPEGRPEIRDEQEDDSDSVPPRNKKRKKKDGKTAQGAEKASDADMASKDEDKAPTKKKAKKEKDEDPAEQAKDSAAERIMKKSTMVAD